MATLQQHKEAMVDLLANGSAIPASASRLAHALHDVLALLEERRSEPHRAPVECRVSENIDGEIRDVKLAADFQAQAAQMVIATSDMINDARRSTFNSDDVENAGIEHATGARHRDYIRLENLRAELAAVKRQRDTYKIRFTDVSEHNTELWDRVESLEAENKELKARIVDLKSAI